MKAESTRRALLRKVNRPCCDQKQSRRGDGRKETLVDGTDRLFADSKAARWVGVGAKYEVDRKVDGMLKASGTGLAATRTSSTT